MMMASDSRRPYSIGMDGVYGKYPVAFARSMSPKSKNARGHLACSRAASALGREQAVAGRQRVHEGSFPPARPRRGKNERLAGGRLEHLLQVAEQSGRELGERGGAMIFHGAVHRAQDPLRDVGRPWDEQEVAAGHKNHHRREGKNKERTGGSPFTCTAKPRRHTSTAT